MTSALATKLTGVRDLKKILETTVKELSESFSADACQIVLTSPLDRNITTVCEYKVADNGEEASCLRLPIALQGNAQGYVALSRQQLLTVEDINTLRVIMAELAEIIRHSQITDVVQRDTFRDTFLVEIGNVMTYSLGIGDALFMVVNILGKVLNATRCLFICTDDSQAGWRCYEYSQQGTYPSCRDFRWPTTDSPVVAHTLLAKSPLLVFEGQENSYVTPMQEELQFIGARSYLGIPLRHEGNTHGCVILQQCDWRRSWTRHEIDMVQAVADKVAEALAKLPAEKLAREPIMQLHQRVVAEGQGQAEKEDIRAIRRALKDALGQQSIPQAQKTAVPSLGQQSPPPSQAQPVQPEPAQAEPAVEAPPPAQPEMPPPPAERGFQPVQNVAPPLGGADIGGTPAYEMQSAWGEEAAPAAESFAPTQAASIGDILSGKMPPSDSASQTPVEAPSAQPVFIEPTLEAQAAPPPLVEITPEEMTQPEMPPPPPPPPPKAASAPPPPPPPADAESTFQPVADISATAPPPPSPVETLAEGIDNGASKWGGDLDSIPTPSSGPAAQGLGSAMFGKPKGPTGAAQGSSLLASLHKDKSKFHAESPEFVEGPPIEIDEKQAQAKLDELLASKDPTSDYIFATPGLDVRMLGRIDGWITQIEQKDKYKNGHARQVAEYAQAIAKHLGLTPADIDQIRLAALLHDVGKLGAAQEILQKPDDQLSDEELLLVMRHPIDGADLLESFPELSNLGPIVRAHHEEFDGNGYPVGLKGEDIPLAARIIAVADSYHAMTSDLVYRSGMNPTQAQEELTKGANSLWDPKCVEGLILSVMQQLVPAKF